MIKTSAKASAHAIHRLIRNTLLFLIVIFIALFFWLKTGITTDRLTYGQYEIDGLYIKLDKKLTLKVKNINIPKSKADPSFKNIDKTFDTIKYLFTFFNYIELEKIDFNNNELKVIFADNILYVTSNDYEIAGNIERVGQKLVADVSLLYIKRDDVNIVGKLTYDLQQDRLETKGTFDAYHIKGDFDATKEENTIVFVVNSKPFTDLRTLINKFPLKPSIKSWIVDKVQAKKYALHYLSGQGNITEDGFKIDFDALRGEILFENVKIFYKEGLSPVLAKSLLLHYKEKGLYFDLNNPTYEGRDLNGSKVSIENLVGKKPAHLMLDLHIQSKIDKVVQKILKAYSLDIPVTQEGDKAKLDIKIDVPLQKDRAKTTVLVNVDLNKSKVIYNHIQLPVLQAKVTYDSKKKKSIVVDALLDRGTVHLYKTKLPVQSGYVHYAKDIVTLKKTYLKDTWYEGQINGNIFLKKKEANLKCNIKKISIGDKEKFFVLSKKSFPLRLSFHKNIVANIPLLKLKIISTPKEMKIEVKDIAKIKSYLKNIGLQIDGGKLDIKTNNFKTYTFKGELKRKSCFLYDKENICHTTIPCTGIVNKRGLQFYAFNKRLYFDAKKNTIQLNILNIDLKQFLTSRDKLKKGKGKKLVIIGKKSKLRYGLYTLMTDSYDIEVKPNGNIKAMGSLDGDIIKFSKKEKSFSIQALRVKDKLLHPLIHFQGLKKGRYSIKNFGNLNKVMHGQIIIEGGIMSGFKAYNNTLAFINTIPALATLHSPGFSEKGFKVKEGVIEYHMLKNKIFFDSIYIKGSSATIVGKGELNIKKKTIHMNLAIQTARELGSVVGNLPLLGYIFMGKDKSMTVGLKITGTLDKPKVQTSAAKDILMLPLQILKRTLESPAHIINK